MQDKGVSCNEIENKYLRNLLIRMNPKQTESLCHDIKFKKESLLEEEGFKSINDNINFNDIPQEAYNDSPQV